MNSYVVSFVTLDEVLRLFFRCMVYIALDLAAGRNVPANDLWIAACAIRHSIPLVTHNSKDFAGIPRLIVISESNPPQPRPGNLFP